VNDLSHVSSEVMGQAIGRMQERNPHTLAYFQSEEGQKEFRQEVEQLLAGEDTNMSGYTAMVEDIKSRLGVGDDPDYGEQEIFSDIAKHGADTGWSGFTHTAEIGEFYDKHEDVLEDLVYEEADNVGAKNSLAFLAETPYAHHPYKTAVAWWALTEVAFRESEI
jgi:hypothetical protein